MQLTSNHCAEIYYMFLYGSVHGNFSKLFMLMVVQA